MARKGLTVLTVLAAVLVLFQAGHVESSAQIMKQLAKGFGAAAEECIKELAMSDDGLNELYNFWNDKYTVTNKEVGCAMICMAKKHNVVGEDGKVHHENGAQFAMKHGADEATAKKVIEFIHQCEGVHASVDDDCSRALEIANCFKVECTKLNWMPDFQELVDEVMG